MFLAQPLPARLVPRALRIPNAVAPLAGALSVVVWILLVAAAHRIGATAGLALAVFLAPVVAHASSTAALHAAAALAVVFLAFVALLLLVALGVALALAILVTLALLFALAV